MGSHVSGERYRGSYKNGLKDGFGEWTHPDGDNYRGKFKAGIKRGSGVYTFENGEKYKGYFKRDKKHGLGSYTYSNGEIFKGEFKNNIRDGRGYIIFRGDTTKSGTWLADKFIKKERLKYVKGLFPNSLISPSNLSDDETRQTFMVSSDTNPGIFYFLDSKTEQITPLGKYWGSIDYSSLVPMELFHLSLATEQIYMVI